MSKILLEVIGLKKKFYHINGDITLFENFNIKVKEGELISLVGPSGSGKSSLLHLLALLDEPSKGKIIINNQETKNLSEIQKDSLRRKNISIIFQDNNLLNDFTAIENIMIPLIIILFEIIIRMKPIKKSNLYLPWMLIDKIRIGAVYALILEAFKLGS